MVDVAEDTGCGREAHVGIVRRPGASVGGSWRWRGEGREGGDRRTSANDGRTSVAVLDPSSRLICEMILWGVDGELPIVWHEQDGGRQHGGRRVVGSSFLFSEAQTRDRPSY